MIGDVLLTFTDRWLFHLIEPNYPLFRALATIPSPPCLSSRLLSQSFCQDLQQSGMYWGMVTGPTFETSTMQNWHWNTTYVICSWQGRHLKCDIKQCLLYLGVLCGACSSDPSTLLRNASTHAHSSSWCVAYCVFCSVFGGLIHPKAYPPSLPPLSSCCVTWYFHPGLATLYFMLKRHAAETPLSDASCSAYFVVYLVLQN